MSKHNYSSGKSGGSSKDVKLTPREIGGALAILLVLVAGIGYWYYLPKSKVNDEQSGKETVAVEMEKETYAIPLSEIQAPAVPVAAPESGTPVAAPSVETAAVVAQPVEVTAPAADNTQAATTPESPTPEKTDDSAQRTAELVPPRSPFADNKPILTTLPPLPSPSRRDSRVSAPSREAAPVTETAAATPPATDAPAAPTAETPAAVPATPVSEAPAQSVATPVPAAPVLLTPVDPVEEAVVAVTPPPAPQAAPEKPAPVQIAQAPTPAPAASGRGKYGVQLAALSGSDRQAKAQALQRTVRDKAGMTAEIEISPNKDIYKVIVVGFADRDAASKAIPGLKQKLGLSEAFVKPL